MSYADICAKGRKGEFDPEERRSATNWAPSQGGKRN